jgi:hypothetical protein
MASGNRWSSSFPPLLRKDGTPEFRDRDESIPHLFEIRGTRFGSLDGYFSLVPKCEGPGAPGSG